MNHLAPLLILSLAAYAAAAVLLCIWVVRRWRQFQDWRHVTRELELERRRGYRLPLSTRSVPRWKQKGWQ